MNTIISEAWSKSKLLVKAGLVGLITIVLLLPAWQVERLIAEREARQKDAVNEVSSKWAGRQSLAGPVLVLPYMQAQEGKAAARHYAYLLPESLQIAAKVFPEKRHRGIYQVMLYTAQAHLTGKFGPIDLAALQVDPTQVLWGEAFVRLHIGESRGLDEDQAMTMGGKQIQFGSPVSEDSYNDGSLTAPLPLAGPADLQQLGFSGDIRFKGSQQLLFVPLGRSSSFSLASSWPDPSFSGEQLPSIKSIDEKGFSASWQMRAPRRIIPQQFTDINGPGGGRYDLQTAASGVDLFVAVNAYHKTMRSVKYALLCIVLTFVAFFLIELVHKRSAHPIHYVLIGLALVLFYALLLSISEYIGFDAAYGIAALATIGLITWFVSSVLASGRLAALLSGVLALLYGYVFTILQLQDFALLLGSIGLFLSLAVVMYFSRKINW